MNIGVIGSGAWGRALATLAAEAGHRARIGYRSKPPGGFPGTPNLAVLALESDLLLLAVPPAAIREVVRQCAPGPGSRVVVAARGLEADGTRLSTVVRAESSCRRVGALAGPALAEEVVRRRPSALLAASEFDEVCQLTQEALHSSICRIYTSHDLLGVELAGSVVRVLACVVGMADAMDLGAAVRGMIVTRGIAEATRLGVQQGALPATFSGLGGVGDLVGCGTHESHPGYQAGHRIGKNGGQDRAVLGDAQAVLALAQRAGVELPITEAIAAIAAAKLEPRLAIDMLMRREARAE